MLPGVKAAKRFFGPSGCHSASDFDTIDRIKRIGIKIESNVINDDRRMQLVV